MPLNPSIPTPAETIVNINEDPALVKLYAKQAETVVNTTTKSSAKFAVPAPTVTMVTKQVFVNNIVNNQATGNINELQFKSSTGFSSDPELSYNPNLNELTVEGNIEATAILTDNYFYSNGVSIFSTLGSGNTGDITFDATTISAPDESTITIESKFENVVKSKLVLNPEYAIAKLESKSTDQNTTFFSGDGFWVTANWIVNQYGRGELVFTGSEQLYSFLNSSPSWNSGENKRFSWNSGSPLQFSGWGYGGGTLNIDVGTELLPPVDPTEITEISFIWDNVSRVSVDSNDYQELQIQARGMNIEIDSTSDVNIEAGDDLRLTGNDVVSIRNRSVSDPITIVTNYNGASPTWSFEADGALTLPNGSFIRETVVTGNPTIELEPANAEGASQKLVIKGGGPVFSNTENGITVEVFNTITYAQGDTVYMGVSTGLAQGTTLYWWIDNYSPGAQFTPDNGELTINEFGGASFNFVVNDDTIPFRVYVADTLYNAYINNLGAVSVDMNAGAVDNSLHLHLTTGDLTATSIFLGTDDHNVRTKPNGNIEVTVYNSEDGVSKAWNFGNDAKLTFPLPVNNDIPSIEFPVPNGSAGIGVSPNGFDIRVLDSYWTFSPLLTGEGTVPAKITFPDGTQQVTAWAGGRVVNIPNSSTGAAGDKSGDISFDSTFMYYCVADYTDGLSNIWKRIAWSADTW
jgi:hypothetical protein